MKVVILDWENPQKIIDHFVAYGYSKFITFSSIDTEYYKLNGIDAIKINGFPSESTRDKLVKIKGSLGEGFFLVYSLDISCVDLESVENFHKNHQCITTLIERESKMVGAIFEAEIFDYLFDPINLEKEALVQVGQDSELQIYN